MAIGSVNRAEFFVTVVQSATFVLTIGLGHWPVVLGLCVGGAAAAPMAALVASRLKPRLLMVGVGALILVLSVRTLVMSL
jgi:uncharacterized membrane protein YfcA